MFYNTVLLILGSLIWIVALAVSIYFYKSKYTHRRLWFVEVLMTAYLLQLFLEAFMVPTRLALPAVIPLIGLGGLLITTIIVRQAHNR